MPYGEHAAVAVADYDRAREPPLGKPAGSVAVVRDALASQLKSGALGGAAVPYAQDIMTAPVESETGEAELRQRRRQEAGRTDIKVHGVAVEQQYRSRCCLAVRPVEGPVERQSVGLNRDQSGAHGLVLSE